MAQTDTASTCASKLFILLLQRRMPERLINLSPPPPACSAESLAY